MGSRFEQNTDLVLSNTHSQLLLLAGEDKRVLELGAADGLMSRVLRSRGCTVTAVAMDHEAADELKNAADVTVIGDLDDPDLLGDVSGSFDIVLAGDVLEQLPRPESVLRTVVQKLTAGGAVVLSIPNSAHIDARLSVLQGRSDARAPGLLDRTRVRSFTLDTLLAMLRDAGLLVTYLGRTVVPPFESELAVERESVDPALLAAALTTPESETSQFIVRAVPDVDDCMAYELAERVVQRARVSDLERISSAIALTTSSPNAADRLKEQLVTAQRERDEARADLVDLAAQVEAALEILTAAERDRDAAKDALVVVSGIVETAQADATSMEVELRVARTQLQAACLSESQVRHALTRATAELAELERRNALLAIEAAHLAELRNSRAYRLIESYRRRINAALPVTSIRRRLVTPLVRVFGLRWR